jgi:putative Mg2+ transporter-C (MgtC) family protein
VRSEPRQSRLRIGGLAMVTGCPDRVSGYCSAMPIVADLEWYEVLARLGLAALLGGAIGIERELDGQDAGFRTHLLLATGAALFGAISVGAFDRFIQPASETNVTIDLTRIASYVAAGVGFLGGGAILKSGGTVKGITTAASIWTVASIGLAAGLGFWSGAVAAGVIALVALAVLKPFSRWLHSRSVRSHAVIVEVRTDAGLAALVGEIEAAAGATVREMRIGRDDDKTQIDVELWSDMDPKIAESIFGRLADHDDVLALHLPH